MQKLQNRNAQKGGATILVVLTLLVLLTVAALSMSTNSIKEIQSTAFIRQGAMAKNVADSGIEWSLYWIDLTISDSFPGQSAKDFINLKHALASDNSRSGRSWNLSGNPYRPGGTPTDDQMPKYPGVEQIFTLGYTIGLTRMGKLPVTDMSQGTGVSAYTPAAGGNNPLAPDLWAVRSDAQVRPAQSSIIFSHAREAWISTPTR